MAGRLVARHRHRRRPDRPAHDAASDTAAAELQKLQQEMPAIVDAVMKMGADCRTEALALNHLGRPTTCVAAPAP